MPGLKGHPEFDDDSWNNTSQNKNDLANAKLMNATFTGDFEKVAEALKDGANVNASEGAPLTRAASSGRLDIVRLLLAHGADAKLDCNALCRSAFDGHLDVVKELLAHGADPFDGNRAALNLALCDQHTEVAACLQAEMDRQRDEFLAEVGAAPDVHEFLRGWHKPSGEKILIRAVKMECFKATAEIMVARGDSLTVSDLYDIKDKGGQSFIRLAAGDLKLAEIFTVPLWRGRAEEMQEAWDKMNPRWKGEGLPEWAIFDFAAVMSQHREAALKKNKLNFRLGGPKG